jgi:hypothetical protein
MGRCEHAEEVYPAEWRLYGRAAAAPTQRMNDEANPDLVVAFPAGDGTADMVRVQLKCIKRTQMSEINPDKVAELAADIIKLHS